MEGTPPRRSPQDSLREELSGLSGRVFLIGSILVVWLLDTALSHRLIDSGAVDGTPLQAISLFEQVSTGLRPSSSTRALSM
ncbi:MAG: hypothetical protein ACOYL4_07915 [Miltoncostaeaceae bacterium]